MEKNWIYPEKKEISPDIVKYAGSSLIAKILVNRGYDTLEKAKAFFEPELVPPKSPYLFKDMEKAATRIVEAIEKQEHIVVYGDFDSDGVTSTSLMVKTLKFLKANFSYYLPNRLEESHGLNSAAVLKLISKKQACLFITLDCGSSNNVEVDLINKFGKEIIITDHHEPPEELPNAFALINPKIYSHMENLDNSDHYYEYLAGVGVAYKLACAVLEKMNKLDFHEELLPLVAIGTIGDVVPLIEENRLFVRQGLDIIAKRRPKSIIKLLETSSYKQLDKIGSEMISFGIVPRINAVGRLGSPDCAVDLLTSDDEEEIARLCNVLDETNKRRQTLLEETVKEIEQKVIDEVDLVANKGIILADKTWHPGIVGIVASKLVEKFYRPVFLMCINEEAGKVGCSARSISGFNIVETLKKCEDLLGTYGGHALAGGFSASLENFDTLKKRLNELINTSVDEEVLSPTLHVDTEVAIEEIDETFIKEISRFEPFGSHNPMPVFSVTGLKVFEHKKIGAMNNHSRIVFSPDKTNNTIVGLWWNKSNFDYSPLTMTNVAFCPQVNEFNGKTSVQMIVKDVQLNENSDNAKQTTVDDSFPRWIDHRDKKDHSKYLSKYLKYTRNSYQIFAENPAFIEKLEKFSFFKDKIVNRTNIENSDELFLFEIPPDIETFRSVLKQSNSKVIHYIPIFNLNLQPQKIIKDMVGMLKFAFSKKNGRADISAIATKLSVSDKLAIDCVDMLKQSQLVNFSSESNNQIVIQQLLTPISVNQIQESGAYGVFVNKLNEVDAYRQALKTDSLESIVLKSK